MGRPAPAITERSGERRDVARGSIPLPPALAFLPAYGVRPHILIQAMQTATATGVRPEQALLASGLIDETQYCAALARHTGLMFFEKPPPLHSTAQFPQSIAAGFAPLAPSDGSLAWLFAAQGQRIDELLLLHRRGLLPRERYALTTSAALAEALMQARGESIAQAASDDLAARHGARFSARQWPGRSVAFVLMALAGVGAAAAFAGGFAWQAVSFALGLMFSGFVTLRLFAAAASCDPAPHEARTRLADADLPVYSVIVALYREAAVARSLAAALSRLDYPAARLDIMLVVETDDIQTREALEALALPARFRIIIAPSGAPRTKPRALNVCLPLARGAHVCVFDAEDIPEPGQLREAAERFAALPPEVACLQGRLAIDNGGDGWLARCFAIEYAALFDVVNPGLAALNLPLPLGGTSNHFRTGVLRAIGGWDAWNVTEDIDLGFRLAHFGYATGTLEASTSEEAPAEPRLWMRQRRRWFKGWIQTLLVYASRPRETVAGMGLLRAITAFLITAGTLAGALMGPFFAGLAVHEALFGSLLQPDGAMAWLASTLACFVGVAGVFSAFWPPWLAMRRRRVQHGMSALALMPAYWMLMTVAAWWAVYDFIRDPFNWLKTEHGLAKRRGASPP